MEQIITSDGPINFSCGRTWKLLVNGKQYEADLEYRYDEYGLSGYYMTLHMPFKVIMSFDEQLWPTVKKFISLIENKEY